jgi:hypothetical protein
MAVAARRLGAIVQGIVLGSALFVAICKMLAVANEAHVFRYQGF